MRVKDFLRLYTGYIRFTTNSYLTGGRCDDETISPVFVCYSENDRKIIIDWFAQQDEELVNAFAGCMLIQESIHGMSEDFYKENPEYRYDYLQMSFSYR